MRLGSNPIQLRPYEKGKFGPRDSPHGIKDQMSIKVEIRVTVLEAKEYQRMASKPSKYKQKTLEKQPSEETSANALIFDFKHPEMWDHKFLLLDIQFVVLRYSNPSKLIHNLMVKINPITKEPKQTNENRK